MGEKAALECPCSKPSEEQEQLLPTQEEPDRSETWTGPLVKVLKEGKRTRRSAMSTGWTEQRNLQEKERTKRLRAGWSTVANRSNDKGTRPWSCWKTHGCSLHLVGREHNRDRASARKFRRTESVLQLGITRASRWGENKTSQNNRSKDLRLPRLHLGAGEETLES